VRRATLILGLLAAVLLAACDDDADPADASPESGAISHASDDLVCGMIDVALVRRIVGDATIDDDGDAGLTDETWTDGSRRADCTVRNGDATRTVVKAYVAEDATETARWRRELDRKGDANADCVRYTGDPSDPGEGYGCTYDSGVFADGAGVHVVSGDRLIRLTVYNWLDATSSERLATAEDIARDIDHNVAGSEAGATDRDVSPGR
jgi:hypothetical protein